MDRMVELGPIVAGNAPGRQRADEITLFCSVGLAGTEVALAAEVVARAERAGG
jgi:ornithine cyclodeaminase